MLNNALFWSIAGSTALGGAVLLVFYLSEDSRMRRRRRKSHSKIIAKTRKPIVKFSVRPPKENGKR